tara:strand:- start:2385 stop:2978 length:594 start_codon:yes stop_codon:yes gene_type:complete
MEKSNYLWILDNGHGGVIEGKYQTKGKRSPKWDTGEQLFEGEFNRDIVKRIVKQCEELEIEHIVLVPELKDITLKERVTRANEIYKKDKRAIFVSVHANAGGGTGYEIFTSKGSTISDGIAEVFNQNAKKTFPEMRNRGVKEANFYVLKNTVMPAVLTENFFMDTYDPDCKLILSEKGRQRVANAHIDAIKELEITL